MAAAKRRHVYQISKECKTFLDADADDDGLILVNDDDDFFDVEPVVIATATPSLQHLSTQQQQLQQQQQQQQQQQIHELQQPNPQQQFEQQVKQQQQKMLQQRLLQQQHHAVVMQQLKQRQQLQLQNHQQHPHNQHIRQHHFQPQLHHQHYQQQQQQQQQQAQQQSQQDSNSDPQRPLGYHFLPHQQQSSPVMSAPTLATTSAIDFPSPTNRRRFSQQITNSGNNVSSWKDTFQQLSRDLQIICSSSSSRESLNVINSRPNSPNSPMILLNNKQPLLKIANSNANDASSNNSQLSVSDGGTARRVSLSSLQFDEETLKRLTGNLVTLAISQPDNIESDNNKISPQNVAENISPTNLELFPTSCNISPDANSQQSCLNETLTGNNNTISLPETAITTNTNNVATKPTKTTTFSTVSIVPDNTNVVEEYDNNVFDAESEITSLGFPNDHVTKIKVRHEETEVSLNRTLAMICRSNNSSPRTSRLGRFKTEDENDDGEKVDKTEGSSVDNNPNLGEGEDDDDDDDDGRKRRLSLECRLKNLENSSQDFGPLQPLIQSLSPLQQDQRVDTSTQSSPSDPNNDNNSNRLSLDASMKNLGRRKFSKPSKKQIAENNLLRFKLELNQINPYTVGVSVDEENGFLTIFETTCLSNSSDHEDANEENTCSDIGGQNNNNNGDDVDADSGILELSDSSNRKKQEVLEKETSSAKGFNKTSDDISNNETKNYENNGSSIDSATSTASSNSTNSSGFEDVDTMLMVSPLPSPEDVIFSNECSVNRQQPRVNINATRGKMCLPLLSSVSNPGTSVSFVEDDVDEPQTNNNNSVISNNDDNSNISSFSSNKCTSNNIVTSRHQLHLLRICEMTSAERLCCTIEDNTLYIREKHHESEFLNFEGFQIKYLPIINEDLVNCKVVITLHVPEQVRNSVQVKTIDNILVLSAGYPQQQQKQNKTQSPSSSATSSLSSSPSSSSPRPLNFRVALTLPPETITRSIDAWMSHGGQLIVRGDTVVGGRRMTCNF